MLLLGFRKADEDAVATRFVVRWVVYHIMTYDLVRTEPLIIHVGSNVGELRWAHKECGEMFEGVAKVIVSGSRFIMIERLNLNQR